MGSPIFLLKFMKEFYTYEQQVEKLKNDNLIIPDEDELIKILTWEGYYNIINGYSPIFKKNNRFCDGVTVNNIVALYNFDKNLRNMFYKCISVIECNIRGLVAHEFSRVHGVDESKYLVPESFALNDKNREHIDGLIEKCNKTIENATKKDSKTFRKYIAHHKNKYGFVPLWALVRAMTFGNISIFYNYMKYNERAVIASYYGLNPEKLSNMLEIVVSFRNIVAHGERTYCAKLPRLRLSTSLDVANKLNIAKNKKEENSYGRNDLLSLFICCKYLVPEVQFSGMITEFSGYLETLKKDVSPYFFKKIKREIGLANDSWKNLPKISKFNNKI